MFRPVPQTPFVRRIPYRLIAPVILVLAMVAAVLLLFSLEQEKLILQGLSQGKSVPTELFPALWQSRRDLIIFTVLVFLVGAFGITALMTFLHYDSARSTLEEVKGLARHILQSIPTGIMTVNRSGIITAVNPTAESVFKRSAADLLGNSYDTVFPQAEMIRAVLDEALRTHHHVNQKDLPYERCDHRVQTIRVSTVELREDDGQIAGVLLQAQDVTEWLALEQRVRVADKLAALHTLSAGVAHELRNPLSAMDLNLHLLEEDLRDCGVETKTSAHYLQVVNAECRRLATILDNFMKFSRPGSMGLHEVDLARIIEHIVSLMRFEAEEQSIRLVRTTEPSLPAVVGDETQIGQVLVNILVNAFHAMKDGGCCRIVAETRVDAGARWVEITVQDTGVGISEEALPRVFEPFYTTKSSGTGLGLAIAYRIMQDHGGSIGISSNPGKGTIVTLRFPALVPQAHPIEAAS